MASKNFLGKVGIPLLILIQLVTGCAAPEPASSMETPLPMKTASSTKAPLPTKTALPVTTPTLSPVDEELLGLFKLISPETISGYISGLSSIQNLSGWRNSATSGEAEAQDWVAGVLEEFSYLKSLGMELEREYFHVFLATETWENRLFLTVAGQESQVSAYSISGHHELISEALRFDSDGKLNDSDWNAVHADGEVLVLRSISEYQELGEQGLEGKIVLVDFTAVDPGPRGERAGIQMVSDLIEGGIAGLVLVTESGGGKYATDGTNLEGISAERRIPMMVLRLEDLATLGITDWEELSEIERAHLVWDVDVFNPGVSGNLVARIPGADPSRAMVLGAHIDSANTQGASDNALNAAVLLETARVLDKAGRQPPVDLYLAWFGSEELGFYGSQAFVANHQEVLDRTIGAFAMDGFTADEAGPIFAMQGYSYARFGQTGLPFADYLARKAEIFQFPIAFVVDSPVFNSDEGPFHGFVPAVRFAFGSDYIGAAFHSPYDTMQILSDTGEMRGQSAAMALVAAIATPQENPGQLRELPEPKGKALILATHTEPLHMSPTMLINLDRALAWEGLDVDIIPYRQSPTAEDLADANLVLALPLADYPTRETDFGDYNESWAPDEIDLLVDYVEGGGFLVLTNSFNRLFFGKIAEPNEDWKNVNDLSKRFGISYAPNSFPISSVPIAASHSLTEYMTGLGVIPENGISVEVEEGLVLSAWKDLAAMVLVDHGEGGGQVLALADLGSLDLYDFQDDNDINQKFLRNLAAYALVR